MDYHKRFHARTPHGRVSLARVSLYHSDLAANLVLDHSLSSSTNIYPGDRLSQSVIEKPTCDTRHKSTCWPDGEPLQLLMPFPCCADTKMLRTCYWLLVVDEQVSPSRMLCQVLVTMYGSERTTVAGYFTRSHKFFKVYVQHKKIEYL